jgi:hypothetical protein
MGMAAPVTITIFFISGSPRGHSLDCFNAKTAYSYWRCRSQVTKIGSSLPHKVRKMRDCQFTVNLK